jgi:signal transduction histidine kinase
VNDILTLEKLHAGELTISVQDIDLRDLLNEAADANAPFAAECEIAFEVETAQEPAFVRADPDRLMQVMSNLMSNAAKLSPPGENVTLSVVDGDAFWRVCVTDKGPGIPPHAREKLFDSFIQVDEENSKKLPSTGLGLTICREVIEQHGGLISFDTEVGVGTTFYFELEKSTQPRALQDVQNVA